MRIGGHALVVDLRVKSGDSVEKAREVWNHAVYRYRTVYWQWLGSATSPNPDLLRVQVEVTLNANADTINNTTFACTGLPATVVREGKEFVVKPNGTGRDRFLVGQVQFRHDGALDEESDNNAWFDVHSWDPDKGPDLSTHHFPPRTALYHHKPNKTVPTGATVGIQGNPFIRSEDVRQLLCA